MRKCIAVKSESDNKKNEKMKTKKKRFVYQKKAMSTGCEYGTMVGDKKKSEKMNAYSFPSLSRSPLSF